MSKPCDKQLAELGRMLKDAANVAEQQKEGARKKAAAERAAARAGLVASASASLAETLRMQQDELAAALARLQGRLDALQADFAETEASCPS